MGNAYISNTLDLIDAITDCNNCSCDKENNERCSRCDFCVIPNYVKIGCTDNTIIGEHILSKPVKLMRNPKSKRSKSKSKYMPPIMPAPIKIEASMTYDTYGTDNDNDSSSMDRVIATIEPYPLPPTPSNSPFSDCQSSSNHYYIPGHIHSNSSSPNGSPLTPLSTNSNHRSRLKQYKHKNSPNSTSEYSTVDINTSHDNDGSNSSNSNESDYNEEIFKRQIQRVVIERNTFCISQSYPDDDEVSHESNSHSMSDIPEEDVVEIKAKNKNSLIPKFEEESDNDDEEVTLKRIKSNDKKMKKFRRRHKDAMF